MLYTSKSRIIGVAITLILVLAGGYFHFVNILGIHLENIPGDYGDSRFNNYILEHCYLYFNGTDHSFWSAPFMYPFKNVIAISDNLLGSAPIYALFRTFSIDSETSYQLWFIAVTLLNFFTSTFVFYKITNNISIAAIGGFIFAFNISLFGQYNHLQMLPRFITPVAIYYAFVFFKTNKILHYSIFIFSLVYQFYCGIYLGFFLLLTVLILFILKLILNFKDFMLIFNNKKRIIYLFVITLVGLLLLFILFKPYYDWGIQIGYRNFNEVKDTIPTISWYFSSTWGTFLWQFFENQLRTPFNWYDHLLYTGGLTTLSVLLSLVFYKKIWSNYKLLFLTFIMLIVLTLSIKEFTLYKLIFYLPGFNALRSISRIINTELFFFALSTVFVLNYFNNKSQKKSLFLILITLLIILDNTVVSKTSASYNKYEAQNRVKDLELQVVDKSSKTCFAYCPSNKEDPFWAYNIDAMLLSQKINLPTVNGYSATCPRPICDFVTNIDTTTLYQWTNQNNIIKDKILILK